MTTGVCQYRSKSAELQSLTHEEIICFGTETPYFKQFHQIEKLPVDIAAYLTQ